MLYICEQDMIVAHNSLLLRNLNHTLPLHVPPLHRFRKLIQDLKRRHCYASLLALAQRLAQQVLKLDEVALYFVSSIHVLIQLKCTYLFQVLLHTRLQVTL